MAFWIAAQKGGSVGSPKSASANQPGSIRNGLVRAHFAIFELRTLAKTACLQKCYILFLQIFLSIYRILKLLQVATIKPVAVNPFEY